MPVTSIRIDEEDLKHLDELARARSLDRTSLIKQAIKLGVKDILLDDALMAYNRGQYSAWLAASKAGISLWEFLDELSKRNMKFMTDEKELERALRELI